MAQLIFTNGSAPATPPSGTVAIFSETDKNMYQIDDTGTVTQLGGGGSGTVSSVSVVSANGLAGTVATATTTPAITLTTTVNSPVLAGNGTAISGATTTGSGSTVVLATSPTLITPALGTPTALVGTNITGTATAFTASNVTTNANLTGDVTSIGNATSLVATSNSTLTTLSALSLPYSQVTGGPSTNAITALTGDGTASGPGSALFTLATVNTNTGSFGSSTSIPSFTVNGKGLITAASGNVVIAPAGTLSGTTLNSSVVTSSLTTVGTIGTGTWQGTTIAVNHGGTGQTSLSDFTDSTSGADGITVTGGVGSVIASTSIAQQVANTTQNGYLSSTDWNTFNGKQSTVSFTSVGSSPNANGGSISSGVITLEPADGTHPGLISTTTQTFAGNKTFLGNVTVDGIESVSGQFLADNGTVLLPGMAFTSDPDCGLYIAGSEELGIAVAGVQAMDFKKSSGGFGNIGMGGAASTADGDPMLIARTIPSGILAVQVTNEDTGVNSTAQFQAYTNAGNDGIVLGAYSNTSTVPLYISSAVIRPDMNTTHLSLMGGLVTGGDVRIWTGNDFTATGQTANFNADHTINISQSVTSPSTPASGLTYYNNAGVFASINTGGSVSSFSGTNTGDQTITLTGDITGSGTGSFATTAAATQNNITSIPNLVTVGTIGTGVWNGTAITNTYLATMNDQTIKGNVSGGSASPSDLTAAQVATMIQAYIGANITYGIYY